MTIRKAGFAKSISLLVAGAIFWTLSLTDVASAQFRAKPNAFNTISAGTTIPVRTTETINAKDSDGLIFGGVVDQAVLDRNGRVAIPAGSDVELLVKETSNNELVLDLDAITINRQRYSIETDDNITTTEQRDGIGANSRTGKYVGGGAIIGAVIGGIAGGKKGAAIGAGAGAAAGAGTQILTRGRRVSVPAETLLTFRLQQPMRTGLADNGFIQNGRRYRDGYSTTQQGIDYANPQDSQNSIDASAASIRIGADNNIRWQAPTNARVLVQVDNEPRKLFAEGQSGTQEASWILNGHRYVFILVDSNGNEIGRDQVDLRNQSGVRRR